MIINNFYFIRIAIAPRKTDSPLIIDANAGLPLAASMQRLQPVPRRGSEIAELRNAIQLS